MTVNIQAATLMISTGKALYTRPNSQYCVYIHFDVNATAEYIVTARVEDDEGNTCLTFAPQFRRAGPCSLTFLINFASLELGTYHFRLRAVMIGGEEKTANYQFEVENHRKNYAEVFNIDCTSSQVIRDERYYQKTRFAYTNLPVGSELILEITDEDEQVVRTCRYPITESDGTLFDYWDLSQQPTAMTYMGRYYLEYNGKTSHDTQYYFYPLNDDDF